MAESAKANMPGECYAIGDSLERFDHVLKIGFCETINGIRRMTGEDYARAERMRTREQLVARLMRSS